MILSIFLEYPQNIPTITPITVEIAVDTKAIINEFLVPTQIASNNELPTWSVPNQYSLLGGRYHIDGLFTYGVIKGEYPEINGCTIDMIMIIDEITRHAIATFEAKNFLNTLFQ